MPENTASGETSGNLPENFRGPSRATIHATNDFRHAVLNVHVGLFVDIDRQANGVD